MDGFPIRQQNDPEVSSCHLCNDVQSGRNRFFSASLILLLLPVPRMTRKAAGRNATP